MPTLSHYGRQKSAIEKLFSLCQSALQNGFLQGHSVNDVDALQFPFTLIAGKLLLTFEIGIRNILHLSAHNYSSFTRVDFYVFLFDSETKRW